MRRTDAEQFWRILLCDEKELLGSAKLLNKEQKLEVAKRFDGVRWDKVPEFYQKLLGRWVADEKRQIESGDITILYNETFALQVSGRKVCGQWGDPLPEARIEMLSNEVWMDKIRRW